RHVVLALAEHQPPLEQEADGHERDDLQHVIEQGERERGLVGNAEQPRRGEHADLERADAGGRRRRGDGEGWRGPHQQAAPYRASQIMNRWASPTTNSAANEPTRRLPERSTCMPAMKRANHDVGLSMRPSAM